MTEKLKPGDDVSWQSHGGTARGKVIKKQVSETQIKGHKVAATKADPQYIVETDEGKCRATIRMRAQRQSR